MLPFEDRFTRQRQLREVGIAGQRRLEESVAVVPPGRAGEVAADYLTRAGVQVHVGLAPQPAVDDDRAPLWGAGSTVSPSSLNVSAPCAYRGPSEYLTGSLAALEHVRLVLGLRA